MAKTLKTRIKNRYDSLTNWSKTGVELLPGEIALVSVKTQQLDEKTGNVVDVPAVLVKVGGYKKDANGEDTTEIASFSELPWVSALAADVYDWAKNEHAKDVNVAVTTGSGASAKTETKTLGAWLKATLEADAANAAASSANTAAIATLNKGENDAGSVANTAKTKIAAALDALDFADTSATTNSTTSKLTYVTKVTQTNGKIAVEKRELKAADLPEITTSMVKTGNTTLPTLAAKLSDMDSKIANFKSGISHDYNSTTGNYVKNVAYDAATGNITVTKGGIGANDVGEAAIATDAVTTGKIKNANVTADKLATDAVTTGKIKNGNVTDEKIDTVSASKVIYTPGTDPVTLPEKIAEVEGKIADINTAIAGGVHFIGTTTTDVTTAANKTSKNVTINSKTVAANQGDIVIYNTREFIWTGAAWEELGDVTRIGNLETKINNLDVTETNAVSTTHKFVSQVTQADGKIAVIYTQPAATDITYSDSTNNTVAKAIAANASAAADALAAAQHSHNSYVNQNAFSNIKVGSTTVAADTTTDTVEFVGSNITITPDATNDKVTFAVADGTTSAKGIVKLSDTYTGAVVADADSKTAATTKAVKLAYAAAVTADGKGADAQTRVEVVENNYIQAKKSGDTYTAMVGEDTIIFDCGGAEI
jgi:uncharacterized FlaG/YvyC family protein